MIVKEDMEVSTSKQNTHASRAYDAIDIDKVGELPISKLENLLDEVGEGFHGDELEKQIQLLDAKGTGIIKRSAFIQWYCNLDGADENDDGSLDTEERKEREEEHLKASETFEKLASNGVIPANDFGKLIEAMGTTYCEEEHKCTVRKISENGVISKNAFMKWYMDWLFGDDDDSDFEDGSDSYDSDDESNSVYSETFSNNDSSERKDNKNSETMDSTKQGWGNIFSVEKDSWKCEVCMVQNSGKSIKCLACETLKPGCEDVSEEKDDTTKVNSTPFTFSFTTKAETSTTPTFSFGFNPPPSAQL
jgi:Ca2+-binding EF-hand superfamily protein